MVVVVASRITLHDRGEHGWGDRNQLPHDRK
jgi:hypothetical protein